MRAAIIARDKPDHQTVRQETRTAHLAYIDATRVVERAGPLLDDAGDMVGSLIILDVHNIEAAWNWAEGDPYAKAGLFESVTVMEWKQVIG
ncbi:hypothetical protein SAMN04490244_105215 [Tranquillimonas rosea]|uniref:YCII-related domain-containing protein n=1 Tax=Tranquillimonas rosea TaxID=641238 RepID=A0A1H9UD75_9RHOB|nr:YciI family protein [Tranquillimonas rosea]SES07520.1 hypothetical protein SAMN04490244_105215 [Tranquillimonas rosea]